MTVIVVVIDESKDSLIKRRAVFLRLDVNIVIFYRSPKSFYPDVVLCPAPAVHTDLHFRMLGARRSSTRTPEGLLRSMVAAASQCPCGWWRSSDGPSRHTGRHVGWHCRRTSMPSRSLLYGRSNWLWDYRGCHHAVGRAHTGAAVRASPDLGQAEAIKSPRCVKMNGGKSE